MRETTSLWFCYSIPFIYKIAYICVIVLYQCGSIIRNILQCPFRLAKEKQLQSKLEEEISSLKAEVARANAGLAAAGRLGEQLESKAQVIATLRQEVKARDEHLKKAQGSSLMYSPIC